MFARVKRSFLLYQITNCAVNVYVALDTDQFPKKKMKEKYNFFFRWLSFSLLLFTFLLIQNLDRQKRNYIFFLHSSRNKSVSNATNISAAKFLILYNKIILVLVIIEL